MSATHWESLTLTNSALLGHFFIQKPGDEWVEADAALTEMSNSSHTGLHGDDESVPPTSQHWEAVESKNGFSLGFFLFVCWFVFFFLLFSPRKKIIYLQNGIS